MSFFARLFGSDNGNNSTRSGTVSSFSNVADTQTATPRPTKSAAEEGGVLSPSFIDRSKSYQLAIAKGDGRVSYIDTDSVDCIVKHFAKEMTIADKQIKQKKQQYDSSLVHLYDYEGDKRYQQWLADQQRVREALKVHWLDAVIDRPTLCLKYLARVGTTLGFFYGLGRTIFLYRTMDKMYAKLHGVGFGSIALYEISLGVVKGAAVSAAGTVGVIVGESATNLVIFNITGDVSVPCRSWRHIVVCGTSCGLFSGAAFSAIHASLLTKWGMAVSTTTITAATVLCSLALAFYSYKPLEESRQNRFNDPHWRPWHTRRITDSGGSYMRGKYT
ncbi:hypothetical protein ERJ75_001732000 [Trypanosoma vivax]|uniref:Uncharacterized protein n=1 Tax=Trypanosoma vivax (strain Y486) TaxID=1055687 RepID=G0U358_TRYVY|nr:hypothetical protein TRVL_09765 [Trypanosoma vivax]KAH8604213.1 hypothetical protein ERJ75_001732000 [Trypanosoma vivax]CCC50713.1 conserved hypothetical protein [Trypanosoma vivax Y486]